jgi:hypothetical protein
MRFEETNELSRPDGLLQVVAQFVFEVVAIPPPYSANPGANVPLKEEREQVSVLGLRHFDSPYR